MLARAAAAFRLTAGGVQPLGDCLGMGLAAMLPGGLVVEASASTTCSRRRMG
jgi:hypothetical protein